MAVNSTAATITDHVYRVQKSTIHKTAAASLFDPCSRAGCGRSVGLTVGWFFGAARSSRTELDDFFGRLPLVLRDINITPRCPGAGAICAAALPNAGKRFRLFLLFETATPFNVPVTPRD
jgi:hypothetical protein